MPTPERHSWRRCQSCGVAEVIIYSWREPVGDDEMIDLVESHGGTPSVGWWSKVSSRSLGWTTTTPRVTVS